jgi:hypothetical protein
MLLTALRNRVRSPHLEGCRSIEYGETWKHDKQRELNFWNYRHKGLRIHPPKAVPFSTGHRAAPRVGLVPVELLLRPWLAQIANSASRLLEMTRPPNAAAAI